MIEARLGLVLLPLLVLCLAGCPSKEKENSSGGTTAGTPSTPRVVVTAAPTGASTAAIATTVPTTAGTSTTKAGSDATFAGEVTTAMGNLTMPEVEKRPFVGKNSDAAGVGPVKLKLVTHADGRVEGDATGSLGDMKVVGRSFDDMISANLVPVSPSPTSFSGTVYGARNGKSLKGDLHAASADGTMIRSGKIDLTSP